MTEKTSTSSQAPAPPPPGRYRLESGRATIRACTARATIDTSSYAAGNARRDRDGSSPALLDAGRFPDITFTGTGARAEHDSWIVDGSVSAHGATDTIQVRVSEARAEGGGAYFRATARLDRTRLGVSGKKGMVGRNVTLSIEARATRV